MYGSVGPKSENTLTVPGASAGKIDQRPSGANSTPSASRYHLASARQGHSRGGSSGRCPPLPSGQPMPRSQARQGGARCRPRIGGTLKGRRQLTMMSSPGIRGGCCADTWLRVAPPSGHTVNFTCTQRVKPVELWDSSTTMNDHTAKLQRPLQNLAALAAWRLGGWVAECPGCLIQSP